MLLPSGLVARPLWAVPHLLLLVHVELIKPLLGHAKLIKPLPGCLCHAIVSAMLALLPCSPQGCHCLQIAAQAAGMNMIILLDCQTPVPGVNAEPASYYC